MYVAVLSFTKINSTITCPQISCVTASTELQDRVRFPRYFQLHPAEETMALAYFAVIKEYGMEPSLADSTKRTSFHISEI